MNACTIGCTRTSRVRIVATSLLLAAAQPTGEHARKVAAHQGHQLRDALGGKGTGFDHWLPLLNGSSVHWNDTELSVSVN